MFHIETKTVHVISHSHWDREWYLPYERHHMLLVELFDTLIRLFDEDPDFASFHLDGQTIPLEDYLQIRPDRRGTLERLVREGKLIIGPWYILQDEWLTSNEANIRNLLVGHAMAEEFGSVCKVGYFPDSFGNMGQAPQILEQAGMDNAVFGRGVKPVGFDNQVMGNYESNYSEMMWRSPNGSKVLGILFANWYNNGMEIPTDPGTARIWWKDRIEAAERYASTPHLLLMNGCDHQPVQTDLSKALKVARELFPDIEFIHSDFPGYIQSVKASRSDSMNVIDGELRSQQTDGWWTLANTASARVYIKQENQACQAILEKAAEPMAAIASRLGREYPRHLLTYSWKTLMQNHPHDSICGCSVDEVHREMMTRFAKSRRVAEGIAEDSLKHVAAHIGTDGLSGVPFAVFNTSGKVRTGTVSMDLDIERVYFGNDPTGLEGIRPDTHSLVDCHGNRIYAELEDLGIGFGYDLPKDGFRKPYQARRFRVTFLAEAVPPMGYRTYSLIGNPGIAETVTMDGDINSMSNEFLKVSINADGTLDILDRRSGKEYKGLGAYEDTGDVGNEYIHKQPMGDKPLTTKGSKASISLRERNGFRTVFEITHEWEIPAEASGLQEEILEMVSIFRRKAQRSTDTVPVKLTTTVSLEKGVPMVKVSTSVENNAKDHRLRVLFPTDIAARQHRADSIFEVAVRDNMPSEGWENPSNCQHQQAFANVSDATGGLTIANKGLNEYEVLHDRNTIAVTLLRCVGELGDWGVFPTPEAQCIGSHTFEYAIIPHQGGDGLTDSYSLAYQEQFPMLTVQTGVHEGNLSPEDSFVSIGGTGLELTAFKVAEAGNSLILRCFNTTLDHTGLSVTVNGSLQPKGIYLSNVLEEDGSPVGDGGGISVGPAGIVTIGIC